MNGSNMLKLDLNSGISGLLDGLNEDYGDLHVQFIPDIDKSRVRPDVNQPRTKNKTLEGCMDIRKSLRRPWGRILQPIIVRPDPDDSSLFIIICGERRWLSAVAESKALPATVIYDIADPEIIYEIQLIENSRRAGLTLIEDVQACVDLKARFNWTHEQIAEHKDMTREKVTELLSLVDIQKYESLKELYESDSLVNAKEVLVRACRLLRRNEEYAELLSLQILRLHHEERLNRKVVDILNRELYLEDQEYTEESLWSSIEQVLANATSAPKARVKPGNTNVVTSSVQSTESLEKVIHSSDEKSEEQLPLLETEEPIVSQTTDTIVPPRKQATSAPNSSGNGVNLDPLHLLRSVGVRVLVGSTKTDRQGTVDLNQPNIDGKFHIEWDDGQSSIEPGRDLYLINILPITSS